MGQNGCYYPVLFLDVLHTPSNTVESEYKRLSSPETEESAEEGEVEEEVADVCQVLFLIGVLESLHG